MKTGKVTEAVLKRYILHELDKSVQDDSKQDKVQLGRIGKGAGIGKDCAFLMCGGSHTAFSVQSFCLDTDAAVRHAILAAVNNVAAGGSKPAGILLSVILPPESEEKDIKAVMKLAQITCDQYSVRIMGGHTEISDGVSRPMITAVGIGVVQGCDQGKKLPSEIDRPGQDIVVSKWIGLEGTALIAHAFEKKLHDRFPARLVAEAKGFDGYLSIVTEAAWAVKAGVTKMHDARTGGIFGALWELAEREGVGITIDLKKIPIRQETIEVCELVDVNPYELLAGGMLLMITDRGEELADTLEKGGIHATIIGRTTGDRDRIVTNGEEIRFLNPPGRDEIYRIFDSKAE